MQMLTESRMDQTLTCLSPPEPLHKDCVDIITSLPRKLSLPCHVLGTSRSTLPAPSVLCHHYGPQCTSEQEETQIPQEAPHSHIVDKPRAQFHP